MVEAELMDVFYERLALEYACGFRAGISECLDELENLAVGGPNDRRPVELRRWIAEVRKRGEANPNAMKGRPGGGRKNLPATEGTA